MPIFRGYAGDVTAPASLAPQHTASVCRGGKHPRTQHLITADEHSLAELEMLLATLPLCATGRVFIEVPDAAWRSTIAAPARMTVTWLERASRSGAPGTGRACAPGQALSRAATAWADEMLCDENAAARVHLLGGFLGTADIFDHLVDDLGMDAADVSIPASFAPALAARPE